MQSPIAWMSFLLILGLLLAFVPLLRRMNAKRIETFQATVRDKKTRRSMTYAGVFIPIVIYYLIVEGGIEIRVNSADYNFVNVGEVVTVSRFSDGSYRLD